MSSSAIPFGTYSFLDVACAISGPGLVSSLGAGAQTSDEGIDVAPTKDINTMTIAADGGGMHSLHADQSGSLRVRLLKSSPENQILMTAYNFQTSSSSNHGKNVVTITNPVTGDVITCKGVAFKRAPDIKYATEGGTNEWMFETVQVSRVLGASY